MFRSRSPISISELSLHTKVKYQLGYIDKLPRHGKRHVFAFATTKTCIIDKFTLSADGPNNKHEDESRHRLVLEKVR